MIDVLGFGLVLVASAGMLWAGWGWLQLVTFGKGTWDEFVIRAVVLICAVLTVRLAWWGIIVPGFRGDVRAIGINMLFDALTAVAAYELLKARLLLIPEDERDRWRWWNAPLSAPRTCVIPWGKLRDWFWSFFR